MECKFFGAMVCLAQDILDGVDHDAATHRDHQDVAGNLNIAVIGRRRWQAYEQIPGQFVVLDILGERLTFMPFFRLPRRLAAIVLFCQTREGIFPSAPERRSIR